MGYPATTHYLTMKLNWMARKLKAINDPSEIVVWTNAMQSVFKVLENFSRNTDLSTPPQINTRKLEFHRERGISVTPSDKETKDSVSKLGKTQRPVVKGVRTANLKVVPKEKSFKKVKATAELVWDYVDKAQGLSMEVEADLSKPSNERLQFERKIKQLKVGNIEDNVAIHTKNGNDDVSNKDKSQKWERSKKLKELWKQALYRTIKGMGKESKNCDDKALATWSLGVTFRDKLMKEQLEIDFPEEYPLGSSFKLIGYQELQAYLRKELNRFFQ